MPILADYYIRVILDRTWLLWLEMWFHEGYSFSVNPMISL